MVPEGGRRAGLLLFGVAAVVSTGLACGQSDREVAAPSAVAEVAQETTTSASTTTTEVPTTTTTEPPETTTTGQATTAPTTATTAPSATTAESEAGGGSDVDWSLVGLIAAIAVAVALLIWLIAAQVRARGRERRILTRRLAHLVGGSRWVHDQASLELMSGSQSPERLRSAWADTRRRINDLAAEAAEAAVGADEDVAAELRRLSSALGGLEGAIDTNVELRLQSTGDPSSVMAINESAETINQWRHELRAAAGPLAARV
jgi:hypothetical protein